MLERAEHFSTGLAYRFDRFNSFSIDNFLLVFTRRDRTVRIFHAVTSRLSSPTKRSSGRKSSRCFRAFPLSSVKHRAWSDSRNIETWRDSPRRCSRHFPMSLHSLEAQ